MSRHSLVAKAAFPLTMAFLLCCIFVASAHAGPANPRPIILNQPDGAQVAARVVGDEWSNGHETLDGYAILRDASDGFWKYADQGPGGTLVLTPLVAGRDLPVGLQRGLRASRSPLAPATGTMPAGVSAVGTRPTLVILAQFGDKIGITTPLDWSTKFFGGTGSVKDHYMVSSYNQMTIAPAAETNGTANDGIVGWVTVSATHPNTAGNTGTANQQVTKDAILAADPFINFAAYDTNGDHSLSPSELMVIVIVAGNETSFGGTSGSCSPSVWGHKWSIFNVTPPVADTITVGGAGYAQFGEMHCGVSSPPGQIATIGIMAHEMGHLLGLPDLYDIDSSSLGIGSWSLMSYGSWNAVTRAGDSPSLLDAWSKANLAFVTPTPVAGTLANQTITAATSSSTVYQLLSGSALAGTGEYFLVENRQKLSYDAGLTSSGLLIWHIDESRTTNASECIPGGACTTVHYKVALIQADNLFNLERNQNTADAGDPFPGTTTNRNWSGSTLPSSNLWSGAASTVSVTSISNSASSMTATLSIGGAPTITTSPVNTTVLAGQMVQFTAAAAGVPTPTMQWQVSTDFGSTFNHVPGATGATYSFTAALTDNGRQFRALFNNASGTVSTSVATLIVRRVGAGSAPGDLDGDGVADLIVWRPGTGTWFSLTSLTGYNYAANGQKQWGNQSLGDVPLMGDIDGDLIRDLIVWRASTGTWYWLTSSSGYNYAAQGGKQWGNQSLGDVPFLGDIDGDGKADLIVWRASTGTWYWLTSSSGYNYASAVGKQWGSQSLGDVPLLGDVDGDGKADLIVWRASTGTWYWLTSSSGFNYASQGGKQWGSQSAGDIPLIGDIDGDGKSDLIVWRGPTGTWYWLTSASAYNYAAQGAKQWGNQGAGDIPLLPDLDGDGKADLVVWRGPTGTWYWLTSSSAYNYAAGGSKQWGSQGMGDIPMSK